MAFLGIKHEFKLEVKGFSWAVKTDARTVWPITLEEAKEPQGDFSLTKKAWNIAYLGITATGILFATFGRDFMGILTHEKFSDASSLVVF